MEILDKNQLKCLTVKELEDRRTGLNQEQEAIRMDYGKSVKPPGFWLIAMEETKVNNELIVRRIEPETF